MAGLACVFSSSNRLKLAPHFCILVDTANGLSPAPYPELSLAKGVPGSGSAKPGTVHNIAYDTTKAARVLGLGTKEHPYTTVEETTRANLEDFKARGWK